MLKKSLAILLSTALALGILVQGSFAYVNFGGEVFFTDLLTDLSCPSVISDSIYDKLSEFDDPSEFLVLVSSYRDGIPFVRVNLVNLRDLNGMPIENLTIDYRWNQPTYVEVYFSQSVNQTQWRWTPGYNNAWIDGTSSVQSIGFTGNNNVYIDATIYISQGLYKNLSFDNIFDNRYMDVYMSGATYGNVRYLCIEVDDIVLSSNWVSVRFTDMYGPGTYIQDYPFDFFTANGHSYIKIMPDLITDYEFTVTSVLYSGSPSWGVKEITGLDLTFNEDVLPTPIPSVVPVPDYSYYDTTYINYNGGNPEIIYTPISSQLTIGYLGSDTSKYYFLDQFPFFYLEQPFSYSFIVIPDIQFEYSSFLGDCIYQYDVVIDDFEITSNNYNQIYSFDYVYGSGAWSNLSGLLTAAQVSDVSSILEAWYASHDPIVYQFPYGTNEAFNFDDRVYDCSLIVTDSFYFKQTNYLLGDTGDILSEFSERFFKIDGFSDSLFDNISSLYNLNLQYYDSSLDALTGLSYWLNDNDISSNLSDITDLLSSLDSYLSSVDGKLNYLVTIDSDLNYLLEWFQNQEDSDVALTLPDFNPSILINIYGTNIGDFVEFVQDFVNTLPEFDFSDFPNFFDYAADLVDDTAGSGDDLIGSLFNPYDYDDSGLHEFGWD